MKWNVIILWWIWVVWTWGFMYVSAGEKKPVSTAYIHSYCHSQLRTRTDVDVLLLFSKVYHCLFSSSTPNLTKINTPLTSHAVAAQMRWSPWVKGQPIHHTKSQYWHLINLLLGGWKLSGGGGDLWLVFFVSLHWVCNSADWWWNAFRLDMCWWNRDAANLLRGDALKEE